MMTLLTQHPSADELRAFALGELPPEVAEAVERHVAECQSCCRALEEAPGDTFEGRLRQVRQGVPPGTAGTDGGTLTAAPRCRRSWPSIRVIGCWVWWARAAWGRSTARSIGTWNGWSPSRSFIRG